MTLASVQMEVKKFWQDRKETKDLIYNGLTKPGPGNNAGRNRDRRKRKKDKKKSSNSEVVAQVTGDDDKSKEIYCFRCGETTHVAKDCPKKGDLKCKAHPASTSHADLACFYYRKSQGLPVMTRARPDGSKDSTRGRPTPPLSQNLVIAEDEEDVGSTDIYTSDEESHGANAAHPDEESDDMDSTEYYSDGV